MEIIIVGAGIGGLSSSLALALAGHKVTVIGSAPQLGEIGAGVQMAPNSTKYFWKWGLGPDILAEAALPGSFNIRGETDGTLIRSVLFDGFTERYGGPYIVIHRADFHRILHQHAVKAGVEIELRSRVVEYDFDGGGIVIADGRRLQADLVIAMDGIKSPAREAFIDGQEENHLEKVGYAAFRARIAV